MWVFWFIFQNKPLSFGPFSLYIVLPKEPLLLWTATRLFAFCFIIWLCNNVKLLHHYWITFDFFYYFWIWPTNQCFISFKESYIIIVFIIGSYIYLHNIPSEERSSYLSLSSSVSTSRSSSSWEKSTVPGLRSPPERDDADPASAKELVDKRCFLGSRRCQIWNFIYLMIITWNRTHQNYCISR